MRKTITLFLVLVFAFSSSGILIAQDNPEDAKFQKAMEKYFDSLWKFFPSQATLMGFHNYDASLEDLSSKSIEKRHEALIELNQEFIAKIDSQKLSPQIKIDHSIMVDGIDLELIKHENLLPWEYNPLFYNKILFNSLHSLTSKEFAPLDARAKSATDRLKALPKFIKQAKENLKTPPELFTQTAVKQFPAILDYYKNDLPTWIEQAPASAKAKLQEYLAKATPELEGYANFLNNELLPRSTGNFRLGEAHRRMIRGTFQNRIPLEELVARARADSNNIIREMFLVCIPFYRIMYPNINLEALTTQRGEQEVRNIVIKGVFDKIKNDHVDADTFMAKLQSSKDELQLFFQESQIIELPDVNLTIEEMPKESQGIDWIRLVQPGIYETDNSYKVQIDPWWNDLDADTLNAFLEEYNNFFIYFAVLRNIYPGTFIPSAIANMNPSLVRKVYPNHPLLNGWPIFVEEMMINAGFGNYDLRQRLNQLKLRLKTVMDFNLNFNIHEGGMTKEQAIAYMTRTGFQTQAEAERTWNTIILNPAQAAYAYVGLQTLLDVQKEYKQKKGDAYSNKQFLQDVLSQGAIPLRELKNQVIQ